MTLGGRGLIFPVGVGAIADFGIPSAFVRVLPLGEGGGLFVNRTLGDVGDVGDVTILSACITEGVEPKARSDVPVGRVDSISDCRAGIEVRVEPEAWACPCVCERVSNLKASPVVTQREEGDIARIQRGLSQVIQQ